MELKELWDIIWRRKWIVLQVFFIILSTVLVGTLMLPPIYEAKSVLLLEDSNTESSLLANIGMRNNQNTGSNDTEYLMENTIEVITSAPVLNKVISNLQISNSDGKLLKPDEFLDSGLFAIFNPHPVIEVSAIDETDLFEIMSSSTDPDEAVMIATALAQECINNNIQKKRDEYQNIKKFILAQVQLIKEKYLLALQNMKKFSAEFQTLDIAIETEGKISRMSELMTEKENTVISISEANARINKLKEQLDIQDENIILSFAANENSYITQLRNDLIENEAQLAEKLSEKKENHPDVELVRQKLNKVKSMLKHEVLLTKQYSTELLDQKRNIAESKARLESLNNEINAYLKFFSSIPEKKFYGAQLQLDVDINQALYESMLQYLYQIKIAESTIFSGISIVQAPIASDVEKPVSPNVILNCLLGLFMGLTCGIGMGLLVDYWDDTVKTQEDIKKSGGNLLGVIPKFNQRNEILISGKSPKDLVTEAYRTIRNSIRFSSLDKSIKSLLITSPLAAEGKSTSVCNLAISMTYEGKKVLIFDADYRRPTIHEIFNLPNHVGSTNVLALKSKIDEAIQETSVSGLSVLSSGPIPPDPARLIESEKMKELIKDLCAKFDIVIFDTPPIFVANDSIILASLVDGFITITESGKETFSIFKQTKERFDSANIKSMGVVLNKFKSGRMKKYDYYYYK